MPGLLRGVARTAVAAGTWTAVSGRVARRQQNRWAQQDQQQYVQQPRYVPQPQYVQQPQYAPQPQAYQPAPAPSAADDRIAKLKDLAGLKAQGILTDEEFAAEKARVLGA
ncbi:MAG TPA: SHOCT domain-containing protein [Solirubrobacteraceae bacterium]|nr:SHOCT domain-containing protein [Solirubrobacteraceae bacterium]